MDVFLGLVHSTQYFKSNSEKLSELHFYLKYTIWVILKYLNRNFFYHDCIFIKLEVSTYLKQLHVLYISQTLYDDDLKNLKL